MVDEKKAMYYNNNKHSSFSSFSFCYKSGTMIYDEHREKNFIEKKYWLFWA